MITSLTATAAAPSATAPGADGPRAELTRLLFGEDARQVHEPWRRLGADPRFHRSYEGTVAEQTLASYERLRVLNGTLDATALARDPRRLAALHEWLAPLDGALTVLAGIHYNLFLGSLLDHDPHEKRPLEEFTTMERIGTFLCTELGHGNDAAQLETTATYEPDSGTFTLHTPTAAAQKFMPNTSLAGGPKSALVAARLLVGGVDHGIFLFLVPLTTATGTLPGISVRPLPVRPGSPVDHCLTSFDQVLLPREALLTGEHGRLADDGAFTSALGSRRKRFLTSIGRVTTGKLCMSASALGAARMAVVTAIRYSGHRHISGARAGSRTPIWAHRSHHGPLIDALVTVYAMTALHRMALDRWAGHDRADAAAAAAAERLVAVAKGWVTWQARDVLSECRERCGAQGLLPVNGISTAVADLEGTITAEGDNIALWAKAGAELLFADTGAVAPAEPASAGRLVDPDHLQALLHAVEHQLFARARVRLRAARAGESLRRWNAAAPDALAGVTAHAERLAAQALLAWADRCAHPATREVLHQVHRLFALRRVQAHSGLLLAGDRISREHVVALPDLVEQTIADLAEHVQELTDAFELPEELLATRPITRADYQDAFDSPTAHWHHGG
ncbi:acyl-CoA dehydrogenase family protein [Goodfellowiella coeruleoviolacea]|uniref:acyl-CoA dehydrogenase family protein n=1 Tax=Goodfellowiella coeruleoviolacea TaxID=334858 RepID=UPI0020A5C206|nr:acyl-CoA dehydrogenase [Goodfellowiella coeruleoviolacea]